MNKLKKDDEVIVISGAHKGKKGKIQAVYPSDQQAIVEGINIKKHKKRTEYSEGGIVDMPKRIHLSNLKLIASDGKPTRVGIKVEKDKRVRVEKSTGKVVK